MLYQDSLSTATWADNNRSLALLYIQRDTFENLAGPEALDEVLDGDDRLKIRIRRGSVLGVSLCLQM